MSFPPPPNNAMFQAFAQGVPPPMPPFQLPLGSIPVPLVPPGTLPMGVTVPAGVTSVSAPPVRNKNTGIIAAPPVIQMSNPGLLYPPSHQLNPIGQSKVHSDAPKRSHSQFTITIFVGNITERASDMLIRQLLSKCGTVNHWKRVQGPSGKLQAFGFCEYSDAESAMRAIRLLHDFEIADKKLIVRVDSKAQEKLDEYRKSKNANSSNESESKNDNDSSQNNAEEELDTFTKEEDRKVRNQLVLVLKEHEIELSKDLPEATNKSNKRAHKDNNKAENLNELELEDEKRNLIHREIDRFRDTYKKYDEEKEKEEEKKKREDERSSSRRRDDDRRSRSRERDDRRPKRLADRDRDRDRRREQRPRERDRDRRSSSYDSRRSRTPVDEEDALLKRRKDKISHEKEVSYQRRLRDWESRERRKAKDYEREAQKENRRKEDEEIEKQKLKQFLQDYDDDRHDVKYYKGRVLNRRLTERQKEIEQDEYEREQERKELEELKLKLAEEGHPDPEGEVRKRLNVKDASSSINDQIKLLMSEARNNSAFANDDDSRGSASNMGGISVKTFGFPGMKISMGATGGNVDAPPHSNGGAANSFPSLDAANENSNHSTHLSSDAKRKRLLMVSDVFNSNEDDEASVQNGKKRRPPPNSLLEDSNTDSNLSTGSNKQASSQMSSEEKKRQIKNLIDKIPTSKDELFNYNIEWDHLDNGLMERRIKPWINKKISDYIGEEEKTLLEFICQKLLTKSSAQCLLDNVAMVLDDEAQVFVVKLWRLLIYEIEAKKLGIGK